LLPDVPWILRRVLVAFELPVDPFNLRLFTMAQASLAGTLVLCAAVALATVAPRLVFSVLGLNALLHLLLDASEMKWGNGVHLLAPFSWRMISFDLISGDGTVVLALTAAGGALVTWELVRPQPPSVGLDLRPRRLAAAAGFCLAYFLAPLPFLATIEATDSYSVKTLREVSRRSGRPVSLDRTAFLSAPGGGFVEIWTGERVRAIGAVPGHDARVSLQGTFLTSDLLRIDRLVEHREGRDWPSYVALVLLVLLWTRPQVHGFFLRVLSAASASRTGRPGA
jgi:hypothetical protein